MNFDVLIDAYAMSGPNGAVESMTGDDYDAYGSDLSLPKSLRKMRNENYLKNGKRLRCLMKLLNRLKIEIKFNKNDINLKISKNRKIFKGYSCYTIIKSRFPY